MAAVSLVRPWIGVVCAYLIVVLQPQAVWFWAFEGVRPEQWVLVPTGIGIVLGLLRREFDLSILASKKNLFFVILWLGFTLSYYCGQYTSASGPYRFDNADAVFALTNKMMILYFMASLSIDSAKKVKVLSAALCGSAVFLVYWANNQYFSGHLHGERLAGPTDVSGGGIYHDENAFAMLFVVAQPFLWYAGWAMTRPWWRLLWWMLVPLCWHAVFLTASRGGLIGLAVTTFLIAFRSKRKLLAMALIPALVVAFVWQGGSQMRMRADTIGDYQQDYSAEGRLQAWKAASKMIVDHPFIGVGLASFGPAFPNYSTDRPREAHNTLLQITAESGILAGLMYLFVVIATITSLWTIGRQRSDEDHPPDRLLSLICEANLVGFCGLVICAIFLSLQVFEIFYLLNVIANAVVNLERRRLKSHIANDVVNAPALSSGLAEPLR